MAQTTLLVPADVQWGSTKGRDTCCRACEPSDRGVALPLAGESPQPGPA